MEISYSEATFSFKQCRVKGGVGSLEVSVNELTVGSFRGSVRFSVRHAPDEPWQEAVVSPAKPLVGFAYRAGLVGPGRCDFTAVRWINATGSGPDHRILGGKSDARESDVLHGELGELASLRGVSLSLILRTRANPRALRDVTTGGSNGPRRAEMSAQSLVKENRPHRMGIIYRLDRHRTPPARFRSSSPRPASVAIR